MLHPGESPLPGWKGAGAHAIESIAIGWNDTPSPAISAPSSPKANACLRRKGSRAWERRLAGGVDRLRAASAPQRVASAPLAAQKPHSDASERGFAYSPPG